MSSIPLKIVIIDDNFLIRETLKSELSSIFEKYGKNAKFFSAENGLDGMGYLYIVEPTLIIIDTTLPEYSGREILDFLTTNPRFTNSKVIVLTEDADITLPRDYIALSKRDSNFLSKIKFEATRLLGLQIKPKRTLLERLGETILGLENKSDLLQHKSDKQNFLLQKLMFIPWLGIQLLLTVLYAIYSTSRKKAEEGILEQKRADLFKFRVKTYPVLAILLLGIYITFLQMTVFAATGVGVLQVLVQPAAAASYTWDGGGTDGTCGGGVGDGNKWSCAANWSSDIVPTSADSVTFNATSAKDAVIDAGFQGTVASFTISSGYTGTITQQRSLTSTSTYAQSDGIFTAANQTFTGFVFTLNSGATFTASSGTTNIGNAFTLNSGSTFNHNSGNLNFGSGGGTTACNNTAFNLVTLTPALNNTRTINSDCTLPLGNNPTIGPGIVVLNGTLTGTGILSTGQQFTLESTGILSGFSTLSSGPFTHNGGDLGAVTSFTSSGVVIVGGTWDATSFTTFTSTLSFTINSPAVFTAPSGTMNLGNAFTINSGATFNHNSGTLNLGPGGGVVACNSTTFNLVTLTPALNNTRTINTDCDLPIGNDPTIGPGIVVLNGTLTGTGTLSTGQQFTLASTGILSGFPTLSSGPFTHNGGNLGDVTSFTGSTVIVGGDWNAGALTTFNSNLTFTLNSPAIFTAPSGTMTLGNAFTINSGSTFNHNSGTLNFGPGGGTTACNNTTFNNVVINTATNNTRTVNSDCNLPLGNNPSTGTGIVVLNGTLTGTGTLSNSQQFTLGSTGVLSGFSTLTTGPFTHNGGDLGDVTSFTGTTIIIGGDWDAGAFNTFNSNLTFTLNSPAVFTAPATTLYAGNAFTINSGSTFIHNNGTLNLGGTGGVASCNNATFNAVTITPLTNNTRTINSNCTFPLGNNPTIGPGIVVLNGNLTGTGILTTSQNFTLNATGVLSGFTALSATQSSAAFTHNGGNLGSVSSFTAGGAVIVAGTWNAGNYTTFDANGTFVMNSGADFTAPSGTATFASTFTINSGSTFTHNNGTIVFDGSTSTLSCNNVTFNSVMLLHPSGTKTVGSNCTLPLGANPQGGANTVIALVTLNGTLTGSGTYRGFAFTLGATGVMSGFDTFIGSATFTNNGGSMGSIISFTTTGVTTVAGAWNAGNYTTFDANSSFIMNSGANFTAPSGNMNLGSTVTMNSGSTFNHNNGTVIFDGISSANVSISCNNQTFNNVVFSHTVGSRQIESTCTLPMGANPFSTGSIILNGALTGSGVLTVDGAFAMNSGSSITCFTSIEANPFFYNGGNLGCLDSTPYTWDGEGTDGTCGGASGDGNKWSCAANWTGDTVPDELDTVIFDSTSTKNSTIDEDFHGTVLSITISTGYSGTITQESDLFISGQLSQSDGAFVGSDADLYIVGTLNMSSPATFTAGSGDITLEGNFVMNTGTTFTGGSGNFTIPPRALTVPGTFTLNSGSTFTAPSGLLDLTGTVTINSGSTFNHNNGTVNFNSAHFAGITLSCNNATFNLVTFDHHGNDLAGTKTVSANCSFPLGVDPVIESPITLAGTLSGSGVFYTGYQLTLNNGSNFTGFTAIDSVVGPTSTSTGGSLLISSGKVFNASGLDYIRVGGNFTHTGSGNFTAPPIMYVGRVLNMTGTFTHNNGTVYITDPQVHTTGTLQILCWPTTIFNLVVFTHTNSNKVVGGQTLTNCNLPVGNNPTIPGSLKLTGFNPGQLTGTGTLNHTGGTLTIGETFASSNIGVGTLSGFTKVIANDMIISQNSMPNVTELEVNGNLTMSGVLNASSYTKFEVDGDFTMNTETVFTAPSEMTVGGDWTYNAGTFNHNNGTVEFIEATDKTISGDTTFNNLKFAPAVDPTMYFEAGSTQTVLGALTLKGQPGEMVFLRSTVDGTPWSIDVQGTQDVEFVNVADSTALTNTIVVGCDSFDAVGNTNWEFAEGCDPSVSNLGPSEFVSGERTGERQPTLTFNTSDPDEWDYVLYVIEIDDSADFTSRLVCYTSGFYEPGPLSFTVGQEVGPGAYSCGEEGQGLEPGNYYWRVKAIDLAGYESEYVTANSGNIAFRVGTSPESILCTIDILCPDDVAETPEADIKTPGEEPGKETPEGEVPQTGNGSTGKPLSPGFINNVKDFKAETLVAAAGIVAATATIALTSILLSAGRDILEKLGFVIGGIVPKKRRYWGIVFDALKSQGIPFAVIRVYQDKKLLTTAVTDLDGRYGIPVSESGSYQLEVKAKGYKPFNKQVTLGSNSLQEIVENIALERSREKLDPIRSFLFYYMSEILTAFRALILVLMVGGFLYSLYVFTQFPILLNLIVLVLYLGLFLLNLYQEYKHRRNVEGRVIDLDSRTGLPNTTVILYNSKGEQEDVRLTNSKGISKLRAKSGQYQVQALKSTYSMTDLETGQTSQPLKVDERGYLTKAIFMKKRPPHPNPFKDLNQNA